VSIEAVHVSRAVAVILPAVEVWFRVGLRVGAGVQAGGRRRG
jgi:hypothetical protein